MFLCGNKFILNTDHNPLVHLREKKDPPGKFARWLSELEEYNYKVTYIPGKLNVKADALSRLKCVETNNHEEMYDCDDNIYSFIQRDKFLEQLRSEQEADQIILNAKQLIGENKEVKNGQLKRINKQLRIENDILTKIGRAIIPRSFHLYAIDEIHKSGDLANHFRIDKTYSLLKKRFYWPNVYRSVTNYIAECITCNKCKADQINPKAPLVPIIVPESPMEFLSIDIAHMETDPEDYRYLLVMGDMFSKYIEAVPMKDQTAETIINAIWKA